MYRSTLLKPSHYAGQWIVPDQDQRKTFRLVKHGTVLRHQRHRAGTYAVAKPWRKDDPWLCVNLIRSRSPTYGMYLDLVSLSRWLDLQTRERHREIKILNVPLLAGKSWITSGLSKPLVRRQVNAILTGIDGASQETQKFARPGAHCESCVSHRCLEMTYER